jgi:hypothetical protein
MTVSTSELWQLGGLLVNDGPDTDFFVENFNFTPAQKKPVLVSNPDADGEELAGESHYTPAYLEWMIRVTPQAGATKQAVTEATLAKAGELNDAVQACEKVFGGQPIIWTVHNTERPYTGYVKTGDITEVPVTATGDTAGWLIDAPVFKIKLTCASFWTRPRRVIKALTESAAEPLQVLYIPGVLGDVPAEAELIVTDKATQDRRFAAWGRDVVTSEANPALLLKASTDLVTTGFGGKLETVAGAFGSEKAIVAIAVSQPTAMFGTGRISHVGSFAIYARVKAVSEAALFRISYRNGDGPLQTLEWKQPVVVGGWSELYMGEVFLDQVELGAQTSEIRFEQRSTEGNPANAGNYLIFQPTTKGAARARGIAENTPTSLLCLDPFEQAEGNLEGKEPKYPTAITWAEAGKTGANGFKVNAGHYLERTAVSDVSLTAGCFALLGATSYATFQSSTIVKAGTALRKGASRIGLLGRYVGTTNYLVGVLSLQASLVGELFESKFWEASVLLEVVKVVAGVATPLDSVPIVTFRAVGEEPTGYTLPQDHSLELSVAANGNWRAAAPSDVKEIRGQSADLASGGALASGRAGLYDVYTSATAGRRLLAPFELLGADEPGRVCFSGRKAQFDQRGCERQDSTGTYDGPPSMYRGGGLYLEPEGELGLINRLAVRLRRNDNDVEEDTVVTDKHAAEMLVTERFLLPR